ncbi:hypothetical protein KEJ27_02285 [Candidatus Bathyarchaeota archaeon]|nr:hypothetical protein [Candidatus Bathyarchaeota archaeon]MBS7613244.1 hypothetical protein [Candidatus Bathyarchaeota archaeon]MBS7618026.1 hypothetical protein [Candidatus Bathyarchaeota archaeon]
MPRPFAIWTIPPLTTLILMLLIAWIFASIPVYIAARIIVGKKASMGKAMLATLIGPIVFTIVIALSSIILYLFLGELSSILAIILAFLAWLASYKTIFDVGWTGALSIAIVSSIIFLIIIVALSALFAVLAPI